MENLQESKELTIPAGIKLSSKDWHYKYMQWFWTNSLAPNKNMFNLCPYFWMFVATLFLTPFVVPLRFARHLIVVFTMWIDKYIIEPIINSSAGKWFENLTDYEIYQISDSWDNSSKRIRYMRRLLGDKAKNVDDYDLSNLFAQHWLLKRNKIKSKFGDYGWQSEDDYKVWKEEQRQKKFDEVIEKAAKKERFEKTLDNFRNSVSDRADAAKDYVLSLSSIILWTKRIIGLMITLIMTGVSFIVISYSSKGILALINVITLDQFLYGLLMSSIVILNIAILIGISKLIELADKNGWKDYWWAQLFMYTLGYPLYYIIWTPGKILFYYFIFELILKNLFFLGKATIVGLKKGFIEFGGIFGAYFGTTKGDYCPGIEWDSEDEEK